MVSNTPEAAKPQYRYDNDGKFSGMVVFLDWQTSTVLNYNISEDRAKEIGKPYEARKMTEAEKLQNPNKNTHSNPTILEQLAANAGAMSKSDQEAKARAEKAGKAYVQPTAEERQAVLANLSRYLAKMKEGKKKVEAKPEIVEKPDFSKVVITSLDVAGTKPDSEVEPKTTILANITGLPDGAYQVKGVIKVVEKTSSSGKKDSQEVDGSKMYEFVDKNVQVINGLITVDNKPVPIRKAVVGRTIQNLNIHSIKSAEVELHIFKHNAPPTKAGHELAKVSYTYTPPEEQTAPGKENEKAPSLHELTTTEVNLLRLEMSNSSTLLARVEGLPSGTYHLTGHVEVTKKGAQVPYGIVGMGDEKVRVADGYALVGAGIKGLLPEEIGSLSMVFNFYTGDVVVGTFSKSYSPEEVATMYKPKPVVEQPQDETPAKRVKKKSAKPSTKAKSAGGERRAAKNGAKTEAKSSSKKDTAKKKDNEKKPEAKKPRTTRQRKPRTPISEG